MAALPEPDTELSLTPQRRRFGGTHWLIGALVAAAGTVGVAAWGQHGPEGIGPHGHDGFGGDGMMMLGGPPEHAARMADHMLDGLHATDAQRAQIRQIVEAAAKDIQAERRAAMGLRAKSMAVFTAPTVDAAAAEALRAQMLSEHDQTSRRMLQAMLDVSRVLTPEQRAKIGARLQERADIMQDRMQRMRMEHGARGEHGQDHGHEHDGPPRS